MSRGDYLRFVVYFLILYAALRFTLGYLLQHPTAAIVAAMVSCPVNGNAIVCGYNDYEIVPECTGIVSIVLLLSLLLVLPLDRSKKIRTAVFGSLFLYILNLFRVYALIGLSESIFAFDLLHLLFWFASPVIVILYVTWLMK